MIPEVKLVPEVQQRDTNNRRILSALAAIGRKHILMARSVAEAHNYLSSQILATPQTKHYMSWKARIHSFSTQILL